MRNPTLTLNDTRLLTFLCDNCPTLDAAVVREFLKEVRDEMAEETDA